MAEVVAGATLPQAADTVVILSSELIEEVLEAYFNKTLFKQPVKIVESRPSDQGYMFSVHILPKVPPVPHTPHGRDVSNNGAAPEIRQEAADAAMRSMRDGKGRYVKKA